MITEALIHNMMIVERINRHMMEFEVMRSFDPWSIAAVSTVAEGALKTTVGGRPSMIKR